MTPQFIPDLIDVEQELFELPQKVWLVCANWSITDESIFTIGARRLQQRSPNDGCGNRVSSNSASRE